MCHGGHFIDTIIKLKKILSRQKKAKRVLA
jgi:hypothetical protein